MYFDLGADLILQISLFLPLSLTHTHAQAYKRDSKGERKQERNRKKDDERLVLGSDPEAVKNN